MHQQDPDVARDDPAEGHLRAIRHLLVGIFLLMLFTATYFARDVLLPIVFALLLTLTMRPIVRILARRGIPSGVTAVMLVASIAIGAAVSVYMLTGPVGSLAQQAPAIGQEVRFKMRGVLEQLSTLQRMSDEVANLASGGEDNGVDPADLPGALSVEEDAPPVQEVVVDRSGLIPQALGSVASVGTSMIAALILTMFMLASGDFYHRRIVEASPRFTDKKRALTIVRDVERQISRYLAAITVINGGLGVSIGLGLWAIGMPMPYMWGIAAFLLNYLPFLGALVGGAAVAAVAVVTFDNISYALLAPAIYLTLTSIEGQIVTPMLVGRRLEINTVSVFVTVVFWIWLWGVPGALLAVPFLVVVKVICDNIPSMQPLGSFLSGDHNST
jgi:predicted PurR-regulated permease PerM